MIQVGQRSKAKYWGNYAVKKVAGLKKPAPCHSPEKGDVLFSPTIVQLEWNVPPSEDKNDLWFPYWITVGGREKYGQFAPMIGQKAFLELLEDAITQDFFDESFLRALRGTIDRKLR